MRKTKGTLAIDFDGTIVAHMFPYIGPLKKDAKEIINRLYQDWTIIIWTCRNNSLTGNSPRYLKEAKDFLDQNGILYDEIDSGQKGKIIADWYIDDRGIAFKNN